MLDKNQIQAIFLFEFKMSPKAVEITLNINNTFGPGAANEHTVSDGSRSFAKETRALKMRSIVTSHWKVTMTSWEPSSKQILWQLHKNLLKNSTSFYDHSAFEANWKGEKVH